MFNAEESEHYNTCTHHMDKVIGIKDAEQVAVFWDIRRDVYHYSLRVESWYSCKLVGVDQYLAFKENPSLELRYIQERVRDLRSLH